MATAAAAVGVADALALGACEQTLTRTAAIFDDLVRGLGLPSLASDQHAPLPPDSEYSLLVDGSGAPVLLLLESPEPLPWRRLKLSGPSTLPWNVDGTRAVVLQPRPFLGTDSLQCTFQGNIGAEAIVARAQGRAGAGGGGCPPRTKTKTIRTAPPPCSPNHPPPPPFPRHRHPPVHFPGQHGGGAHRPPGAGPRGRVGDGAHLAHKAYNLRTGSDPFLTGVDITTERRATLLHPLADASSS